MFKNPQVAASISSAAAVLAMGTWIFHRLENWTWVESLYFTVATSTTVGYGDLHPTSTASQLFAVFYMLFGTAVLITSISYVGAHFVKRSEAKITASRQSRKARKSS